MLTCWGGTEAICGAQSTADAAGSWLSATFRVCEAVLVLLSCGQLSPAAGSSPSVSFRECSAVFRSLLWRLVRWRDLTRSFSFCRAGTCCCADSSLPHDPSFLPSAWPMSLPASWVFTEWAGKGCASLPKVAAECFGEFLALWPLWGPGLACCKSPVPELGEIAFCRGLPDCAAIVVSLPDPPVLLTCCRGKPASVCGRLLRPCSNPKPAWRCCSFEAEAEAESAVSSVSLVAHADMADFALPEGRLAWLSLTGFAGEEVARDGDAVADRTTGKLTGLLALVKDPACQMID